MWVVQRSHSQLRIGGGKNWGGRATSFLQHNTNTGTGLRLVYGQCNSGGTNRVFEIHDAVAQLGLPQTSDLDACTPGCLHCLRTTLGAGYGCKHPGHLSWSLEFKQLELPLTGHLSVEVVAVLHSSDK